MTLKSVEGVEDKGLRFGWKGTLDVKLYVIAFLIKGKLQHSQKIYSRQSYIIPFTLISEEIPLVSY